MKTSIQCLNNRGITAIELLLVATVLGYLGTIVLPMFSQYRAKARATEGKVLLSTVYITEESWFANYSTHSSCLKYMGMSTPNMRYFSFGFTRDSSFGGNPSSPNGQAVANGAPEGCLSDTSEDSHFYRGNKAIGAPNAPDLAETVAALGQHIVDPSGAGYMVTAYAHLGGNSIAAATPSFIPQAYADTSTTSLVFTMFVDERGKSRTISAQFIGSNEEKLSQKIKYRQDKMTTKNDFLGIRSPRAH